MNKTKRRFVLYFLLCFAVFVIAEDLLTAPLALLEARQEAASETMQHLVVIGFLLLTLLNVAGCAWLFSHLIGKAFQKEARQRMEERNLLYSCTAHDLKTPMTSVQGFAAALREGRVKPEEQQEIYGIIYNKSCYMNELLDTMFAYSNLNTDSYTLTTADMDICALMRSLTALHYDEFEEREMALTIDIPDDPIRCRADEKELKRAVSNLLVNACKHNRAGAEILIRVSGQQGKVCILIADDGQPIDREAAETLFEPFARGDASRSGGGTGLGLAISRLIAEKHGGSLTVEKGPEGYTKGFLLCLKQN